jgi:hypothetical protein
VTEDMWVGLRMTGNWGMGQATGGDRQLASDDQLPGQVETEAGS